MWLIKLSGQCNKVAYILRRLDWFLRSERGNLRGVLIIVLTTPCKAGDLYRREGCAINLALSYNYSMTLDIYSFILLQQGFGPFSCGTQLWSILKWFLINKSSEILISQSGNWCQYFLTWAEYYYIQDCKGSEWSRNILSNLGHLPRVRSNGFVALWAPNRSKVSHLGH